MTCVAEDESSCGEVDGTHEHRREDALLVAFRSDFVQFC